MTTAEGRLTDARFLGAATPVAYVVTRSQPGEAPRMVRVHFAGVPRHGLRHAEDVGASGTQETVPEPHIGAQLGVIPRIAADIVTPHVARRIVSVHHVAVVPESVPVALLHFLLV